VFLDSDGNKAPVTPSKMTLGVIKTGAVHIGEPVDGVLGLAEGVESAIAAHQMTTIPVWGLLKYGGLGVGTMAC
jgi:putative DNA primase/helicase